MKNGKIQPERCGCGAVHEGDVREARRHMPPEETLADLADFYKSLGDSTRVRILAALLARELCVCDIATLIGMTQSAVSHQLRILKHAKLVKSRREGKAMFYSLDDEHVRGIFKQGIAHMRERIR